ncbi:sensor histidine kinase [Bifidobacterium scaligerum]|uniref:sensor histidine kinase n=1 Tax=Bifidobacterium scaligerum TaxID=2052656 RepID=UPI001FAF292B|nr:histidine kinase [Bifidobacterium scaligerum]
MKDRRGAFIAYISRNSTYIRYLLPAISIILTLAETWSYPPNSAVTGLLVIIHIGALALMAFRPMLGANIVVVSFLICCLIPDDSGPSFLWGIWLALAYAGLYVQPPYGAIYPLAVSAVRMWRFDETGTPVSEYVMLLFIMFLVFFAGRAVSWSNLANQAEQDKLRVEKMQQHLAMIRKENIAASQIHDSVTGNLTYMAILLDRKSLNHENVFTETEVTELRTMLVKTLGEVRSAINLMNGDDAEHMNDMNASCASQIQTIAEQGDRTLAKLGFSGKTRLSSNLPESINDDCSREIVSLLQELYTNTAAHAKPNGEYYISVNFHDSSIHIDQVNDVSDDNLFPDKPASRNGLKLHIERIRSLGGNSRISTEDGTWQLHVRIPLESASDMADPV